MTACKSVNGRAKGRPRGRGHVEIRRRSHRLAPGVIGLCLVMVLATFAFVVLPSPARASNSGQTSGLFAANNGTGPDDYPGFYLTLNCPHGTIDADAMSCNHQSSVIQDVCDSPSCQFSLSGTVDSGYEFHGWTSTGVVITCSTSCLTDATLTVYVPNQGGRYAGSVALSVTQSPPTVTITVSMFENWSTGWTPASEVKACLVTNCSIAGNGGTLTLEKGQTYTLSIVGLVPYDSFFQWTTNAGKLSSPGSSTSSLNVASAGTISLYASTTSASWAGYIYSPPAQSGKVTSVSAAFHVPSRDKSYDNGVWVGIGGLTTRLNLFQAVVQVNSTISGGGLKAYMEEVGVSTCTRAQGGCVQYSPSSFSVGIDDKLIVTVTNNSGSCTASFKDITRNETWTNSTIWFPNAQTGEWMDEPLGVFKSPQVNFTQMVLNAFPLSLIAGLIVDETQGYAVTMLAEQGGYPSFYIN